MNIINTSYDWNGSLVKRSKTTRIILHHAAAIKCTAQDIHRWHLNRGWAGIGYHFFVNKQGKIYEGRPENVVGAHAGNNNLDSIGVCFEGNFEKEQMTNEQIKSGKELVSYLKGKYNIIVVQKHKDVNATVCPGKNFPFNEISCVSAKKEATPYNPTVLDWQKAAIADGYKFPRYGTDGKWGSECEAVANKAVLYRKYPYRNKSLTRFVQRYIGVEIDGKYGKETEKAVRSYQAKNKLNPDGKVGANTYRQILGLNL